MTSIDTGTRTIVIDLSTEKTAIRIVNIDTIVVVMMDPRPRKRKRRVRSIERDLHEMSISQVVVR